MSLNSSSSSIKPKQSKSGWERLKQQELSAWQPIFSPKGMSPCFLFCAIVLIPLGVLVFTMSKRIQELTFDYTHCLNPSGESCAELLKGRNDTGNNLNCTCSINFVLEEPLKGEVHLYYALSNFYQNHRQYISSRDDEQLLGKIFKTGDETLEPSSDCEPLHKDSTGRIYFPCGAIANSMFNDEFQLVFLDGSNEREVDLIRKGIAWESDKKHKFKNPDRYSELLIPSNPLREKFARPKNWVMDLWDLEDGLENEDFIVWMRTSALPNFRKMHRFIDSTSLGRKDEMPSGNYSFKINYNYEVSSFGGTKTLILTEQAFFGGSNTTLGIMLMSVGSFVLLFGFIFLFMSLNKRKTWSRKSTVLRGYGTQGTTTILRPKVA